MVRLVVTGLFLLVVPACGGSSGKSASVPGTSGDNNVSSSSSVGSKSDDRVTVVVLASRQRQSSQPSGIGGPSFQVVDEIVAVTNTTSKPVAVTITLHAKDADGFDGGEESLQTGSSHQGGLSTGGREAFDAPPFIPPNSTIYLITSGKFRSLKSPKHFDVILKSGRSI